MKKIAFYLRKLADLFDSSVKPSPEPMTIEIRCDATQAIESLERVRQLMEDVEPKHAYSELIPGTPPTASFSELTGVILEPAEPGDIPVLGYSDPKA